MRGDRKKALMQNPIASANKSAVGGMPFEGGKYFGSRHSAASDADRYSHVLFQKAPL